ARDVARQIGERAGQGLLLVVAGDLDDELHAGSPRSVKTRQVTGAEPALYGAFAGISQSAAGWQHLC
ncbi:MAG: hypothetical protein ACRDLY_01140, partial [Thermoleophilaceae bacterium]